MDLFDYMRETALRSEAPLAVRMRPRTLEEIAGQPHILGEGKLLYRAVRADVIGSMILYGPPGCGKTTIAEVISRETKSDFCRLNATTAGKKEMEEVIQRAKENFGRGKRTTLFVDEIHRFHKGQQDFLLPYVEDGTIALIGATTENPFFEVNAALLSRSRLFELKPLSAADIEILLRRAMADAERGYGSWRAELTEEALHFLAEAAAGDARTALNALELGMKTTAPGSDGSIHITEEVAEDCIQKRAIRYDKDGDNHYDTVSAFIKSMRGSDPDAAIYYLARMLYAGEDPRFIARRIVICAAEDVGNADPMALVLAESMAAALDRIGMPEGRLLLSQACLYVASAPKSNAATTAIFSALDCAERTASAAIPPYLQDAHYPGHEKLGRGMGYRYPHDYPNNYVAQVYLPETLRGTVFYVPTGNGKEAELKARLAALRAAGEEKDDGRKT
mgnify:FL=1